MFQLTASELRVIEILQNHGNVYLVGGCVRDKMLGRIPKDHDMATSIHPNQVEHALTLEFVVIPDAKAKQHGIVRIVDKTNGKIIDIATLRKDVVCDGRYAQVEFDVDILEDMKRRDLTINAMATQVQFIDGKLNTNICTPIPNSMNDINNHVVRFVGDPNKRIEEDALRMIRACRFTALGPDWKMSLGTINCIRDNREKILSISKERIRDEIVKSLTYPTPSNFWRSLLECNLLEFVAKPLTELVNCEQNEHHNFDPVWDHSLRALDVCLELDPDNRPLFRLAVLFHDIGKPRVKTNNDGKINFYKHEVAGVDIVAKWMTSLHFANKDIVYVSNLVRHHQWRFDDTTKDATLRRWLRDVGKDTWKDLIYLRCCDRKGNLAKMHLPIMTREIREIWERVQNFISQNDPIFKEDLAIDGKDIIALGVLPGPQIEQIKNDLLGLVWNDPTKNTRETLIKFVEKKYNGKD